MSHTARTMTLAIVLLTALPLGAEHTIGIPPQIKKIMDTESGPLKKRTLSDGISVLSSGDPSISRPAEVNGFIISTPIGSEQNVECMIDRGATPPSRYLENMIAQLKEDEEIEVKSVDLGSGMISGLPYIGMEVVYITPDRLLGTVKLLSAWGDRFSVHCMHDEVGYRKTMFGVVESLIGSHYLVSAIAENNEFASRSIMVMKQNQNRIGFSEKRVYHHPENHTSVVTYFESSIHPGYVDSANYLSNISQIRMLFNEDSCDIERGEYLYFSGNSSYHRLNLKKEADNLYIVSGEENEERVEKSISTRSPLRDETICIQNALSNNADFRDFDGSMETYMPVLNSRDSIQMILLSVDQNKSGYRLKFEAGRIQIEYGYKNDGRLSNAKSELGPISLILEEISYEGMRGN